MTKKDNNQQQDKSTNRDNTGNSRPINESDSSVGVGKGIYDSDHATTVADTVKPPKKK